MTDIKHSSNQIDFQVSAIQDGNKTVDLKKYVTEKIQFKTSFQTSVQIVSDPWIYPNSKDSKSCLDRSLICVLFAYFCFHVVYNLCELIQNLIFISFWYQKALLCITAFSYDFFYLHCFFSLSFFNLFIVISFFFFSPFLHYF